MKTRKPPKLSKQMRWALKDQVQEYVNNYYPE